MAYRGTGAPQFGTGGLSYTMPRPIKGGRIEKYEPIQEVYENILHKIIPAERVLRFTGEYEFNAVPSATLNLLVGIYNRGQTLVWAPHSDLNKIRYHVIVDELVIQPINGLIDFDGLLLKLRALDTTNAIPTGDNIFDVRFRHPIVTVITT